MMAIFLTTLVHFNKIVVAVSALPGAVMSKQKTCQNIAMRPISADTASPGLLKKRGKKT